MGGLQRFPLLVVFSLLYITSIILLPGCVENTPSPALLSVPHIDRWGIYALDLDTETVELIYSTPQKLDNLDPDKSGGRLLFTQYVGGEDWEHGEIYVLDIASGETTRLTENDLMDVYPVWAPDNTEIAFLSWREADLDIYIMDADGHNQRKLHDSGGHDGDIDWASQNIVFTAGSRIWIMREDSTGAVPVTDPPRAGEWGKANLPFGDYDPRLSPDGKTIVFERLEDDTSAHGNYNFFSIRADGTGEKRLTSNGYSQGTANWSPSGEKMVFIVAAIGDAGKYDIYTMHADGSNMSNVTPDYFPEDFLCHAAVYSPDGSRIFFIGEWWQ